MFSSKQELYAHNNEYYKEFKNTIGAGDYFCGLFLSKTFSSISEIYKNIEKILEKQNEVI